MSLLRKQKYHFIKIFQNITNPLYGSPVASLIYSVRLDLSPFPSPERKVRNCGQKSIEVPWDAVPCKLSKILPWMTPTPEQDCCIHTASARLDIHAQRCPSHSATIQRWEGAVFISIWWLAGNKQMCGWEREQKGLLLSSLKNNIIAGTFWNSKKHKSSGRCLKHVGIDTSLKNFSYLHNCNIFCQEKLVFKQ